MTFIFTYWMNQGNGTSFGYFRDKIIIKLTLTTSSFSLSKTGKNFWRTANVKAK